MLFANSIITLFKSNNNLGNNFYQECGDLFSVMSVDNPDKKSEIDMVY
jgi:hypothetical protein